jgi:hypothetical protein
LWGFFILPEDWLALAYWVISTSQDFLETVGMAVPWMPKQCRTAFQKIHPYIYGELLAESHRHSLPFGE